MNHNQWPVVIIDAAKYPQKNGIIISGGGNCYSLSALRRAASKFSQRPIREYHNRGEWEPAAWQLGRIWYPHWNDRRQRLEAIAEIESERLQRALERRFFERTLENQGLSMVADALDRGGIAQHVVNVVSVDLEPNPGFGGRFLQLTQQQGREKAQALLNYYAGNSAELARIIEGYRQWTNTQRQPQRVRDTFNTTIKKRMIRL